MKALLAILLSLAFTSCSFETLYKMRQRQKVYGYEQIEFTNMVSRYMTKSQSSVGTIEGIYSVTSLVTKKGKGLLSATEKEKVVSRDENFSKVAIIKDSNHAGREYLEVPITRDYLPSYDVRGEFTGMTEGNILVYKHFESRGRVINYTFTYDRVHDILEGVRTENNGNFVYTYKLTYLKLTPKSNQK